MITCQCNVITERDLEEAIVHLLDDDAWRLIVPVQVYHELGKRGRCCGCFPNVVDVIIRTTEAYHRAKESPSADVVAFMRRLREKQVERERVRRVARNHELLKAG